jgi:fatty-acyl-CoA synthase
VPINFRLAAAEVAYIVDHCGASVLLVDPELADTVGGVTAPSTGSTLGTEAMPSVRRTDGEPAPVGARRGRHRHHQLHEGTTARPKGVQQTHRSLWLNAIHLRLARRA